MLEVSDKDFEAAIIKMFQWAITNMMERVEKVKTCRKVVSPNKYNRDKTK